MSTTKSYLFHLLNTTQHLHALQLNALNVMIALLAKSDNLSLRQVYILAHSERAVIAHGGEDDVAVLHKETATVAILTAYNHSLADTVDLILCELANVLYIPLATVNLLSTEEICHESHPCPWDLFWHLARRKLNN